MSSLNKILDSISDPSTSSEEQLLIDLVAFLRPPSTTDYELVNHHLAQLNNHLENHPLHLRALRNYLFEILAVYDLHYFFTEYNVLTDSGFLNQLRKRFFRKFIPALPKRKSLSQLILQVFHRSDDEDWISEIDLLHWNKLLALLRQPASESAPVELEHALLKSAKLLSFRIAAFSLDDQIRTKFQLLEEDISAFFDQNQALTGIYDLLDNGGKEEEVRPDIERALRLLDICKEKIAILRSRKSEIGTSTELTFLSRQVRNHIDRLQLLLRLYLKRQMAASDGDILRLLGESIHYQQNKNSIANLVKEQLDLVALQVVEQNANQGEKYIAEDRSAYWRFLRAAMLGGFIIAIFAMMKIFLSKVGFPPFVEALAFSINYALCFILVKMFGGIIATKQPAMTATSIIRSIDANRDGEGLLAGIRDMIVKVSRSQFISFVGNLLLAFPMAILIAFAFENWIAIDFLTTEKTDKLIKDLQPWKGGAVFYAAIAGVFLSLSGLISGYFDNKVTYSNIPARIQQIRWIRRLFGPSAVDWLATYVKKKLGALVGNASLGFFLGFAGFFGYITGLPIDIRHIAFSSANFGFFFDLNLSKDILLISALSIYLIGTVNFLVSFGITLTIALKARKISFGQSRKLIWLVIKAYFRNPVQFLFPVGRTTEK